MTNDDGASVLPIVAIGASAGGVTALQRLFERIPADTGACFVVIVHLDPDHESHLGEILAAKSNMPVTTVKERSELRPNCVYVIPPNRRLEFSQGAIATQALERNRGARAPIDAFFRSYAENHGDGFAVILTGAGSDGALGVKAVKEAEGIVLVQDPLDAEYASMPRSAIATGVADVILPLPALADELARLIKAKAHHRVQAAGDMDDEILRRILTLLRARTGHDFLKYKRSTVLRRIGRRMQLARIQKAEDYATYLREHTQEAEWLFADLLISVTTFFRDPAAFKVLAESVLPKLFEDKEADSVVRVWVPGCATGEEAYSMAMLLLEEAARRENRPELQIFASDLDAGALTIAREGVYPLAIEADVSEERLRRFFVREEQSYRVKREVRDLVLFATHSLLKDPPFSRLDLISCRNLMIYLDRDLQQQVIGTFNYALLQSGYLFLGSSESADMPPGLFRVIDREARLYQSIERVSDKIPALSRSSIAPRMREVALPRTPAKTVQHEASLHRHALEDLAPPSILVDESHHIIHVSDTAGRYLLHPAGSPTSDLTELIRPELRMDLRSALHRALEQNQASLSLPVPVQFNGKPQKVYVQVKPATATKKSRMALVIFIEGGPMEANVSPGETVLDEGRTTSDIIRQLRDELQATRGRLKASREEEEAANEELRAANEELQCINEEYRSTAEELETSREELHSINEELQTLNNELKLKLESVSRAHDDLQNLMAATDVGTLFLDSRLRIKRFTPSVADLFNITGNDEGRPITDFTHQLDYHSLPDDARSVLKDLAPLEREMRHSSGTWFLMRLRPYRTMEDKIEGVVVTFVDITVRRRAEEALRVNERRLQLAQEAGSLGVQDFSLAQNEYYLDETARALWGIKADEVVTLELLWSRVDPEDLPQMRQRFEDALQPDGDGLYAAEFRVRDGGGAERWVRANGQTYFGGTQAGRHPERFVCTVQDVTDRKAWETRQRLLLSELSHRVKNTLAVVQSMARQTFRHAKDYRQGLAALEGRLEALSTAHELLVNNDWQGAQLEPLLRSQLGAQLLDDGGRIEMSGPPVLLPADLATPFGLVIHELGTNAVKYGAFSNDKGTIRLTWTLRPGAEGSVLEVHWAEEGGPPPLKRFAPGFGSSLIQNGLPSAQVQRSVHENGLLYTIILPLMDGGDSVHVSNACDGSAG